MRSPSPVSLALHWLIASAIVIGSLVAMFYAGRASAQVPSAAVSPLQLQIGFWELLGIICTLVATFLGVVWRFGTVLIGQFEKHLAAKFTAMETEQQTRHTENSGKLSRLETQQSANQVAIGNLERMLPLEYVRREDWIRFSGTIDAKMDRLHDKLGDLADRITEGLRNERG